MATIPQVQRYGSNIPKGIKELDSAVDSVVIVGVDGQRKLISYTDFMDALATVFVELTDIKLYYGTSANSLTISAGVQTFDTQAGLAYVEGQRIRLTNAQDYYMEGVLTSYVGNAMSVTVDYRTGSGSYSSWTLSPTTEQRVPTGGGVAEVLTKNSSTDYDASWQPVSGVGGGDNSDYNNSFFLMGG
jgi:hypothetical protein